MYAITMAFAYSLEVPNLLNNKRTRYATLLFASGAIIGWPFCLALAIPFVFEELFIRGADTVIVQSSWMFSRCMRLFAAGATASILFVSVARDHSVAC
jgi:alpha-1,2-mannosyltransferase